MLFPLVVALILTAGFVAFEPHRHGKGKNARTSIRPRPWLKAAGKKAGRGLGKAARASGRGAHRAGKWAAPRMASRGSGIWHGARYAGMQLAWWGAERAEKSGREGRAARWRTLGDAIGTVTRTRCACGYVDVAHRWSTGKPHSCAAGASTTPATSRPAPARAVSLVKSAPAGRLAGTAGTGRSFTATPGGHAMAEATLRLLHAARAVAEIEPESSEELERDLLLLARVMSTLADSLMSYADGLEAGLRLDPRVTQHVRDGAELLADVTTPYTRALGTFRRLYEPYIEGNVRHVAKPDFFGKAS